MQQVGNIQFSDNTVSGDTWVYAPRGVLEVGTSDSGNWNSYWDVKFSHSETRSDGSLENKISGGLIVPPEKLGFSIGQSLIGDVEKCIIVKHEEGMISTFQVIYITFQAPSFLGF